MTNPDLKWFCHYETYPNKFACFKQQQQDFIEFASLVFISKVTFSLQKWLESFQNLRHITSKASGNILIYEKKLAQDCIKKALNYMHKNVSSNLSTFCSEYESAMSDIEETMSILSRRSRSTTPISATKNWSVLDSYGSLDRRLKTRGKFVSDLLATFC